MVKNQAIICFAPSDWWGMNPSCTTHLMKRLAAANKVLYINPFSSDLLGVTRGKRRGFWQRLTRKLKSMSKWLKKPQPNLYVFSPIFIPIQGKKAFDWLNNRILVWQIKLACRIGGIKEPLLWLENVRAADLLPFYKGKCKVYHVSDLFSHDGYTSSKNTQQNRERQVSEAADVIICVSKELYSLKKQDHANVHYLPHGVDFEIFREAAQSSRTSDVIRQVPHPIAGYFGTLTGSNDIDLWEYCATQMPDVSFVLAGRVTGGDYSRLRALPNVTMPGHVPYEQIPSLCAAFDVCMLNWRVTPWIRSCNPLKMFEYMASGHPVVSVDIEEATQYQDVISIARNKEEFCEKLRWELSQDTPERRQKRIQIAREHDWQQKVEKVSEIIQATLHSRSNHD